jgi:nucleoid DNA-binding protein
VTGEQVKRILKRFIYELHNKLLDGFVVSLIRMGNLEYKTAPAFQRSSKFLNDGIMEIPERKILKFKASSKAKHTLED